MSEFVDCRTCKSDCVRADGNYGYTFCDKYTHPPMTNADRIRAMSDEELADMLWKTGRNYRAVCAEPVVDYNEHYEHLIEWLQQPAEEDDHA